jgi:aerobic-type carbon monoxide dehydrogenase small subunit (CoxS/CutS family)
LIETIRLTVNGDTHDLGVPSHYTLLETLRYVLGYTGPKQGCDKGDCGACTVLLDGVPTLSCILPVQEAIGKEVTTTRPTPPIRYRMLSIWRAARSVGSAHRGF